MKTIALIDGNHMVRRHHHTAALTDAEGNATGGLFGFLHSIHKFIEDVAPDGAITVWDSGIDAWRREIWPGYKDRRETNPKKEKERKLHSKQVSWQIDQLVNRVLPYVGLPAIKIEGCEADDLIHIARKEILKDYRVIIVSGDKDFLQMVDENTWLYDPMAKDGKKYGLMVTPNNFRQASGLENSRQFLDYRTLVGDSSDKIPGVPGVGPATAENLIFAFGSISRIIKSKDAVREMGARYARVVSQEGFKVLLRNRQLISLQAREIQPGEVKAIRKALRSIKPSININKLERYSQKREAYHFAAGVTRWSKVMREHLKRLKQLTF